MAILRILDTYSTEKGDLSVAEKLLPHGIKRVYYIKNVPEDSVRGGHRHKKTSQALITIQGSCFVDTCNGMVQNQFHLDSSAKCLILNPEDYHTMHSFTSDCILLVLANEEYSVEDYIDEPYI
jgi:hypothetical protein